MLLVLVVVGVLVSSVATATSPLYIGQYIEGSGSYNRAVEVCNEGAVAVDLGSGSGTKLVRLANGGQTFASRRF